MASIINALTTGGGGISVGGDTSGIIQLQSNNTATMTVDTSGNVGIGTTTPASDTANERIVQVNAPTTYSTFSLSTSRANTDGQTIGKLSFDVLNNTATYRSRAQITSQSSGSTANKYGGNLIFFTASDNVTDASERMRIDSSGNFLVGATSTSGLQTATAGGLSTDGKNYLWVTRSGGGGSTVDIGRTSSAGTGNYIEWWYNGSNTGTVSTNGSTTSYNTSSDYRLKHDIQPMTGALAKVAALKPVTYKWNSDNSDGEGFIAHELQEVVPEAVTGAKDAVNEDGSIKAQGIDTSFLVATLTAAIQEQQAIITALTARIEALENK